MHIYTYVIHLHLSLATGRRVRDARVWVRHGTPRCQAPCARSRALASIAWILEALLEHLRAPWWDHRCAQASV